jgi:glycosyltransferase involved in cell wall biosynthesis
MPVYNREKLVTQALRSLIRQCDDVDLDIIVVDDGSTDGSAEAVRTLAQRSSSIRLVSQPNRGVTNARNTGLRHLLPQTKLVSFLDSDDLSPAGRFKADVAFFHADPAIEVVYSWLREVDIVDDDALAPGPDCSTRTYRGIQLASGVYRRDLIDALGGFDEDFVQAEDTDFLFRMFERKPRHVLPDTVGVYYRKHANSLMADAPQEVRREFMRACYKSMIRRRADPSLGRLSDLIKVDERSRLS